MIGIERDGLWILILVRMMVLGRRGRVVSMVVPVVEIVGERKGVKREEPGERRRTGPEAAARRAPNQAPISPDHLEGLYARGVVSDEVYDATKAPNGSPRARWEARHRAYRRPG